MNKVVYKFAGVIVRDKKLLVTRTKGKPTFYAPGGKPEDGETPHETLIRELHEELGIRVIAEDLEEFGSYEAQAADQEHLMLKMQVFTVKNWEGELTPQAEIEEAVWANTKNASDYQIGSIFARKVIPRLAREGSID